VALDVARIKAKRLQVRSVHSVKVCVILIALSKTTKKRYNERKKGEEKWQERIQRT